MKPRHILLVLPLLCLVATTHAQQTTYTAGLNSGWFYITSKNASNSTSIIASPTIRGEMMGPRKSSPEFSYEINGRIQRHTNSGFIYGAELAYQSLHSSVTINYITPFSYSSSLMQAGGKVKLNSNFITVSPYAGFRLLNKKINIDLSSGIEFAACVNRNEEINAKQLGTGDSYHAINTLRKNMDYRIRFQLVTSINRIGLTAGYASGLRNYYHEKDMLTGYSRFIRLGLTYRIH
ncbi:MAG: hypothetical protein DI535_17435 [Citrobacter freundii]|nr:MAG: hypothetical protein DI535_17435 [Citrobacter freundii]